MDYGFPCPRPVPYCLPNEYDEPIIHRSLDECPPPPRPIRVCQPHPEPVRHNTPEPNLCARPIVQPYPQYDGGFCPNAFNKVSMSEYLRDNIKYLACHVESMAKEWTKRHDSECVRQISTGCGPSDDQRVQYWHQWVGTIVQETNHLNLIMQEVSWTVRRLEEYHCGMRQPTSNMHIFRRCEYMLYLVLSCLMDLRLFHEDRPVGDVRGGEVLCSERFTRPFYCGLSTYSEPQTLTVRCQESYLFPENPQIRWKLPKHLADLKFVLTNGNEIPLFNEWLCVDDFRDILARYAMHLSLILCYPPLFDTYDQVREDAWQILGYNVTSCKQGFLGYEPPKYDRKGRLVSHYGYPDDNVCATQTVQFPMDTLQEHTVTSRVTWEQYVEADKMADVSYLVWERRYVSRIMLSS